MRSRSTSFGDSKALPSAARSARLRLIAFDNFDWGNYLLADKKTEKAKIIKNLILEFEKEYYKKNKNNKSKETTFTREYLYIYKKLPPEEELTSQIIINLINQTDQNTRIRKTYYIAL